MINRELIEVFSEIAREKNVERSELATILEDLFLYVIEKEYGDSSNCSCIVNLDKGEIEIYAEKQIVEEVMEPIFEITLEEAQKTDPSLLRIIAFRSTSFFNRKHSSVPTLPFAPINPSFIFCFLFGLYQQSFL